MKFERVSMPKGHSHTFAQVHLLVFVVALILTLLSNSFILGEVSWKQPSYTITTVNPVAVNTNPEGNNISDYKGSPIAIDFDQQDNMYILDSAKWVIKVNTSTGYMKTMMGSATYSDVDNVDATSIAVGAFSDMSVNKKNGEVFLVGGYKLKKINMNGKITNYYINSFDVANVYGDGGKAINSKINAVAGVTVNSKEEIIFTDSNRIRKIYVNGSISTVVGNGTPGATMNNPTAICVDKSDNIIFVDMGTYTIKKVSSTDNSVKLVAGLNGQANHFPAELSKANQTAIYPKSIAVHPSSGEIYFATFYTISRIGSDGLIYRVAGNGSIGIDDTEQQAILTSFQSITHISFGKNGDLFIVDNIRLRKISSNVISLLLVETQPPTNIYYKDGEVYYTVGCQILKLPDGSSTATVVLGLRGTCSQFFGVKRLVDMSQNYLAFDPMTAFTMSLSTGRMYFSNYRRMWNITDGYIYPMVYNYGENIDIKDGLIESYASSCFDNSDNLILGDNFRLRMLNTSTHVIKSIIGNDTPMVPFACAVAPNGDIYFKNNQDILIWNSVTSEVTVLDTVQSDYRGRNYKIKLLASGALIYTNNQYIYSYYNGKKVVIAGSASSGAFYGEGGLATNVVQSIFLLGLTANSKGEIYYSEDSIGYIRKLTPFCSDSATFLDSTGTKCLGSSCYGVDYNSLSVCSGHGTCVSQNNCSCKTGYFGAQCEQFTCFGLNNTDSKVCSGNGTCTDIDTCSCKYGYQPECKDYVCYGYSMDNPNVCSSHGKCVGNNKCQCTSPYNGTKCDNYSCFGLSFSNPKVCNGYGNCTSPDTCVCSFGLLPGCYTPTCSGKPFNDTTVCSSGGLCVADNVCACLSGRSGTNCEIITLSYSVQGRPTLKSNYNTDKSYPSIPVEDCGIIFATNELKYLGSDPICKLSSTGLEIMLGYGFTISNGTSLPTQSVDGWKFNFQVQSGTLCSNYLQTSLSLDFNTQATSLQNLNSDTVLRVSESDYSQLLGRTISWSGPQEFTPLVSTNQKIVIIPKGYWASNSLPITISTKTSLCGFYFNSRTFTFKTDSTSPAIDIMTDTSSGKLNCVGYDCLVEFSISPSGTYKPQIKFEGDYSPIIITSTNLQIARLSNYWDNSYLSVKYNGNVALELLYNSEKQSISYTMNYVAFENSQLFINNLNRGFSKDQTQLSFSLVSRNPLLFTITPSNSPLNYNWTIYGGNQIIGNFLTSSINIPNPGVGNYSLTLQVKSDVLSETLVGLFSVFDVVGAIPDISVESFTNPYPFVKTLDLTVTVNSTTPATQISWNVLTGSFYNSPVLSNFVSNSQLSQNNFKTALSIPSSYLKEGSNYVFEVRVTNSAGTNVQRMNVKMDFNPRFSCDYFSSYNSSQLNIYDSKLIVSCSSFENNIASYVMDLFDGDLKLMTLSNTVKSSVITRIPYSMNGLSLSVRGVNRNGSYRKIVKSISGPFLNIPSSDASDRVSYVYQQWNNLKNENIKMDTASSILSLLTYLQNGKQTFDDLSALTDKQKLTTLATEMISSLKSITTIGYRADDKIAAILLSPTLRLVKLVKVVLPTVYSNQKTDIQYLTSFIVKGVESVTSYYSSNVIKALVDGVTFNETVSLVQNVYSSIATSGLLGELTRLQLIVKPSVSLLNSVSYQSPQEISGKTIELSSSIQFTFPSNFYSQISSSIPFSLVSSQEQSSSNSSSSTVSISLFKSDGSAFKIQGLTSYIEIIFSSLEFKTENVSCVYFDETLSIWSKYGMITTIIKKQIGFNVKCETNHLTAFSVIVNDATITPTQSPSKSGTIATSDNTLAIVLGVVIPSVVIIASVVVLIIVLLVVCMRKKKTKTPERTNVNNDYEQPSVSAYQHSKTNEVLTDTELSVMSDFPSNNSMFMKPLISVYSSSAGSTSSTSSKFDPMSRYKNLVRIGQGGFGSVFKAEDSKCGNQLKALKVIKYSSVEELNTILKEGNRLMNISHPYILHVNDVLIDSDQILCIDMDYYEKGDLNQFVKVGSECPEKILKQILFQMCTALDYVHNTLQIVHRDIKPSNIFIKDVSQDNIHLILADFGLARQTQGSVMFSYAGTPLFMSTELALGGKYTANTDIYSLGVTLYQIITKDAETSLSHQSLTMDTAEFEKTIHQKMKDSNPSLSDSLLEIIVSMLKRDYASRPYPKDILANSYFQ